MEPPLPESKCQKLLENIQDVMWSVNWAADRLGLPTTFVSTRSLVVLGYSPEEFFANHKLWQQRIHPEDRESIEANLNELSAQSGKQTRLYRFRHGKTNEYRWLEDQITIHATPEGQITGMWGVARDVTDRVCAERRERQRSLVLEQLATGKSHKTILESIVDLVEKDSPNALGSVLLLDKEGKHLTHGARSRLPDFYQEAIQNLTIGPGVGSCGTAAYLGQRVIVEDIQTHPYWEKYRDLAARAGLRACWSEPILSTTGRVLGTFAIYHAHPQTPSAEELEAIAVAAHLAGIAIERSLVEESLRESESRFRTIFDHAAVGVAHIDTFTGRILRVNSKYSQILGYSQAELLQYDWMTLTPPEDLAVDLEHMARLKAGEIREFTLEKRLIRRDGNLCNVNLTVSPMWQKNEPPSTHIAVIEDITQRKKAEEDQRKLELQLLHTQKLESLGIMAGGIAHDFNNLLTGILGYSDLALQELTPGSPAHDYITEAVKGSRRAAELTKQMLAYSGKGSFSIEKLSLVELIEDMRRLLEISISKRSVLKFHLSKQGGVTEADPSQLQQVILNLVLNASEAIGDKPGTISVSLDERVFEKAELEDIEEFRSLEAGRYVVLEVSDTGCGMDRATRTRIFDPFFTTKFTGRGLGLATVLGIIRGHHGAIRCLSELGNGTTFQLLFLASTTPVIAQTAVAVPGTTWRSRGTILVVDDEESVRQLASEMVSALGFDVISASDGCEAVELFRKSSHSIRLVLLDMVMPRLDGRQTLAELRQLNPTVPVLLTSGYNEQSVPTQDMPVSGFLQKPYRLRDLARMLQEILEPCWTAERNVGG